MSILHVKCVLSLRPALSLRTRNNCELAHHHLSWWWCNSTSFNSTSNDFTFHQCHDESLVVWPVGFHLIDNDSRATRDKLYPSDTGTWKKRPFSLISFPPSQYVNDRATRRRWRRRRPGSVARYTIVMDIIIAPQLPQQQEANAQITPQEVALFQSHSTIHPSIPQVPSPRRGIIMFWYATPCILFESISFHSLLLPRKQLHIHRPSLR